MARRIDAPVRVILNPSRAAPIAFLWEERRYRVCHVDACWKQVGPWWDGGGERTVFRVSTEDGVYELIHDHASGRWLLERMID